MIMVFGEDGTQEDVLLRWKDLPSHERNDMMYGNDLNVVIALG